jgi:hypothetical protein
MTSQTRTRTAPRADATADLKLPNFPGDPIAFFMYAQAKMVNLRRDSLARDHGLTARTAFRSPAAPVSKWAAFFDRREPC